MKYILNLIFTVLALQPLSLSANEPENTKNEIQHLINYVATAGCTMQRNGTNHTATESVSHIKKKYEYFIDKIDTAEALYSA